MRYANDISNASNNALFAVTYVYEAHDQILGNFVLHALDPFFASSLNEWSSSGNLEKTLTFLISDHGIHYGDHYNTLEGQIDHKLPLFYIIAPRKWLNQHPRLELALEFNQNVLITPFDFYHTVKHILTYPHSPPEVETQNSSIPALSLFEKIDPRRSCGDACIPVDMCLCEDEGWTVHATDAPHMGRNVTNMVYLILGAFNNESTKLGKPCVSVQIQSFKAIRSVGIENDPNIIKLFKFQIYVRPVSRGRNDFAIIEASVGVAPG